MTRPRSPPRQPQGWRKPKTRTLLPSSLSTERTKLQSTKPTTPTAKPTLVASGLEPVSQQDPTQPTSPANQTTTKSSLDATAKSPERGEPVGSPQKTNGGAAGAGGGANLAAISPTSASKNSPSSPKSLKDSVSKVKKVHPRRAVVFLSHLNTADADLFYVHRSVYQFFVTRSYRHTAFSFFISFIFTLFSDFIY